MIGALGVRGGISLLGLLALVASCSGSDDGESQTQAAPEMFEVCAGSDFSDWSTLPGVDVEAAVRGEGPLVVLANESGNQVCAWAGLADRLVADNYRVAVFQYADETAAGEEQAVEDTLAIAEAAAGNGDYALVGASLGGRIVIEAAAQHPEGLAAIVSLSGVRAVQDYVDILPDARLVTTPALYLGSVDDSITDGARQPRQLSRAMHGTPNELVLVPGSAHGDSLVEPASSPTADTVVEFLHEELAATN